MIVHVARRASKIKGADRVIVATDDKRIRDIVTASGFESVMTAKSHKSGTSRVSEAASMTRHGIIVNIQGDEPVLPVSGVERLIAAMKEDRRIVMATLAARSDDRDAFNSRDVVKVVASLGGDALYFSRSPVPVGAASFLQHIGIYAFRRKFLLEYTELGKGPLEKIEDLEQLRALENGYNIRVIRCREKSLGVDAPEDIKRVEKIIKKS